VALLVMMLWHTFFGRSGDGNFATIKVVGWYLYSKGILLVEELAKRHFLNRSYKNHIDRFGDLRHGMIWQSSIGRQRESVCECTNRKGR
jgi:hypothetical protein